LALFATLPLLYAQVGSLSLRSADLLSLPSHPAAAANALGFVLSSGRLGDAALFQTAGMVCTQGKQKAIPAIAGMAFRGRTAVLLSSL